MSSKIEKAGAKDFVLNRYAAGDSFRNIADKVKQKYSTKISHQTVKNFVEKEGVDVQRLMNAREDKLDEAEEVFEDTIKQAKKLNRKAWMILKKMERKGDERGAIKAMDQLWKQLERQNKLLSDFIPNEESSSGPVNIKELNVEIENLVQNQLVQILNKLEKRGLVDVKGSEKEITDVV